MHQDLSTVRLDMPNADCKKLYAADRALRIYTLHRRSWNDHDRAKANTSTAGGTHVA